MASDCNYSCKAKKQISTTSLVPTIARVGTNKNIPNQTSSKARPIEYLRDCLKTNQVVNIVADSGILEVGTYDFSVTCEEYFRLLRKLTTDASIITVWQLILHSMARTCMNKCAFLNPYNILGEACQKNPKGVVSYLVDSIRLHHGKFTIISYLYYYYYYYFVCFLIIYTKCLNISSKHWVLLVISLHNRIVYILDSKDSIEKSADYHYLLKKHVDM
uniref:Ubiquitin-like protease family profile domain-containing protein n=1 Tax=Lactuca sativa TaxID=4236 RepID=A0A9R1V999_LACSA|nr:hypothetical protein LSAT_V11C600327070 [Lactuca sativa]